MGRLIFITGTPGAGKTTVARCLVKLIGARRLHLRYASPSHRLGSSPLESVLKAAESASRAARLLIVDGHFLVKVPRRWGPLIFVLRCNPTVLKARLEAKGYSRRKVYENLWAEALDYCLQEAISLYGTRLVHEVDTTHRSVEDVAGEVASVIMGRRKLRFGICRWLTSPEGSPMMEDLLMWGARRR